MTNQHVLGILPPIQAFVSRLHRLHEIDKLKKGFRCEIKCSKAVTLINSVTWI